MYVCMYVCIHIYIYIHMANYDDPRHDEERTYKASEAVLDK